MTDMVAIRKEMRKRDDGVKISFPRGKVGIRYLANPDQMRGFISANLMSVHSEGVVIEETNRLQLAAFDFQRTNGSRNQKDVMETFLHYWCHYAESEELENIQMEVDLAGYYKPRGGTGKTWGNYQLILTAAREGFLLASGRMGGWKNPNPVCLEMKTQGYQRHKEAIEVIESFIALKHLSDKTFLFEDTLLEEWETVESELMVTLSEQVPFYSGKLSWEGFIGRIGFYEESGDYVVRLFREVREAAGRNKAEYVDEFKVKPDNLSTSMERVLEMAEESQGMINALQSPCTNLTQFLEADMPPNASAKAAEKMMVALEEVGYHYKDVESEMVKRNNLGIHAVDMMIMDEKGIYFKVFSHYALISYNLNDDANPYKEEIVVDVVSSKEELREFFLERARMQLMEKLSDI